MCVCVRVPAFPVVVRTMTRTQRRHDESKQRRCSCEEKNVEPSCQHHSSASPPANRHQAVLSGGAQLCPSELGNLKASGNGPLSNENNLNRTCSLTPWPPADRERRGVNGRRESVSQHADRRMWLKRNTSHLPPGPRDPGTPGPPDPRTDLRDK